MYTYRSFTWIMSPKFTRAFVSLNLSLAVQTDERRGKYKCIFSFVLFFLTTQYLECGYDDCRGTVRVCAKKKKKIIFYGRLSIWIVETCACPKVSLLQDTGQSALTSSEGSCISLAHHTWLCRFHYFLSLSPCPLRLKGSPVCHSLQRHPEMGGARKNKNKI